MPLISKRDCVDFGLFLPITLRKDQKPVFRRPSLYLAQRLQMIHPIKEPIRYNEAQGNSVAEPDK